MGLFSSSRDIFRGSAVNGQKPSEQQFATFFQYKNRETVSVDTVASVYLAITCSR